jgi:cellulose synthase/poly-beta-1,6-N-acetylglucosamine synthase-like glycosyltransferase
MLISVVIPAYNAEATIATCVNALQGQDYEGQYEVIVVDDGSTDGTGQVARGAGATVIVTSRARPAAARNAGICAARGAIVCCTDADCAPRPDWLRLITAPFSNPDVAACKGSYSTRQREIVARFVQLEYEDKYDLLRPQATIDFIDTYSAAYRRGVLLANGGFDERFDYLEDQELSFRLAARGCRMVFQEAAVVDHRHSATLRAYLRKKAIIGYWKAQVVRRFPGRAVKDSHTPQVMKVQMALATFLTGLLLVGLVVATLGAGRWGNSAAFALAPAIFPAVAFLATTMPFVRKAWPKDRAVAVASPLLLFGRALALSAGYAWGLLKPRRDMDGWPSELA